MQGVNPLQLNCNWQVLSISLWNSSKYMALYDIVFGLNI